MKGYAAGIAVPLLLVLTASAGALTLVTAEEAALLYGSGDGLTVFKQAQHRELGVADIEATETYLKTHNPIAPPASKRVQRVN